MDVNMKRIFASILFVLVMVAAPLAGRAQTFVNGFTSTGATNINMGATFKGSIFVQALADPSAPTVTVNTTGSSTHTYYIVGHDGSAACGSGNEAVSNVSAGTTVTNSASTPNNSILLPSVWLYYDVLKDATNTSIATCILRGSTVTDTGQATSAYTAPVANTSGGINGVAGTQTWSTANLTGTDTINFGVGAKRKVILTANETLTISDSRAGSASSIYVDFLEICQNATGNWTLTFANTNMYGPNQTSTTFAPAYTLVAHSCDFYEILWNGTKFITALGINNVIDN